MATTSVRVSGLNKCIRSLQKFGVEVEDLKAVFSRISNVVIDDARNLINSRSGDLAGSLRASKTKNKAIVRAGSARVPYAGVIEYGGYNGITPQEYLQGAAEQNQSKAVQMMQTGINALITKYGLK